MIFHFNLNENVNMTDECNVCIESFTAKNPEISCPHCQAQTCRVCVKRYLIESSQTPHCMACKKAWSNKFVFDSLPKSWIHKEYRQSRQKLYVDREKALLPQTLGIYQERINREVEIEKLQEKKKKIMAEMARLREERMDIDRQINELDNIETPYKEQETKYTFPCSQPECRGFIEANKWKCGLCQTKICKSCHVVKTKDHECKQEDVDTAKMIVKETKPCPTCKSRIFKLEGCDQMFCTSCHTAFSWTKGTIETGVVHNPHFFELQQKLGTVPRNVRDIPCGGVDYNHVADITDKTKHSSFFDRVIQRVGEVNNHIANLTDRDFLEVRLTYLRGKMTNNEFRSAIFRVERYNEKHREERQILETFRVSAIERLNNLTRTNIVETKKDIQRIVDFCNDAFMENYTVLGYKTWPQIDLSKHYGL